MNERQPRRQSHDDISNVKVVFAGDPDEPRRPQVVKRVAPTPLQLGRLPARLRQRVGAVLLAAVIVTVVVATSWPKPDPPNPGPAPASDELTVVKGYGGELKVNFMNDPEVQAILADKYGLEVDIIGRGSVELACGMKFGDDDDFVWLGDQVALARYANRGAQARYADYGCTMLDSDNVYNSPVVLYSWTPVVDALVAAGVAEVTPEGAYTLDFAKLVEMMMAGTTWANIGLTQLHGKIIVHTTDPNKSNSGLLFAGLLANTLNGGEVVTTETVEPLLPDIRAYFQWLGLMQPTSGDLFEQFLITGMGGKPIVALYESQIPEFLASNPAYQQQIAQRVRILYPKPTVWASHPFVARTDDAKQLLTALMDPDIQRLAWEEHGQRPGVPGLVIDPDVIPVPGIISEVPSVTPMPSLEVMDMILEAIAAPIWPPDNVPPGSATPASAIAPIAPLGLLALIRRATRADPGRRHRVPGRRRRLPTLHAGRAAARRLSLLVVLLGLITPSAAVAQGDVDVDVNVIVGFAAPYAPEPGVILIPSANFETVLANDDDVVVVTNGEFNQPAQIRLEALEGLDADTDGLVSVDAGTSADPMYWLDLFTVDDVPYGAFTISRPGQTGTTITMFMASVDGFADGMAVAQQSVVVDGSPIFDGVDPGGLQTLLDAALPELVTGADSARDDDPATEEPDTTDAFDDMPGMIAAGRYESPHHGFALTWTDEWMFDSTYDAPVTSDVNYDFDEVHLTVSGPEWVWFGFYAAPLPPGVSFAELMDRSSSASRLELEIGPNAEVVVSRIGVDADGHEVGALIIRVTLEGYDFIVYEEYRSNADGSAFAALQFAMVVDDAEAGLEATESLEFEHGPVISVFTHDEILSVAQATNEL